MVRETEIFKLLHKYFRTTGEIRIDDAGLVSCTGNVELTTKISRLPVRFDHVVGNFSCCNTEVNTLEGAPRRVDGWFDCSQNWLKSLAGAPRSVGSGFICSKNQLATLEGAPQRVGKGVDCSQNRLKSLAGAPQSVGGNFWCIDNKLTTLEGLPQITGTLWLSYSPTLPLLRCLLAKKVMFIPKLDDPALEEILSRYAGQGEAGAFACGAELATAGFKENARW